MYTPIIVTRHIQDGSVVGLVIKYDPPCPPIQVCMVKGKNLERILPNGKRIEMEKKELKSMVTKTIDELRTQNPFMRIEDVIREFKPEEYLTNPLGEYDIF